MLRIALTSGDGGWGESLLEGGPREGEGTIRLGFWTGGAMEQEGGPEVYSPAGG